MVAGIVGLVAWVGVDAVGGERYEVGCKESELLNRRRACQDQRKM